MCEYIRYDVSGGSVVYVHYMLMENNVNMVTHANLLIKEYAKYMQNTGNADVILAMM